MKMTPQILAMYLGCQVRFDQLPYNLVHTHDLSVTQVYTLDVHLLALIANRMELKGKAVKPKLYLRKLEDMTEDECAEIHWPYWHNANPKNLKINHRAENLMPEEFAHLLSKSFDLFGLIEAGEAIDAKTLKS